MTRALAFLISLLSILAGGSRAGAAEDFWLVTAGEPTARIVLPEKPSTLETFTAEELRTYVRQATGAELESIADTAAHLDERIVCVGDTRFTRHLAARLEAAATDTILLKREGNRVLLLGRDSPGLERRPIERYPLMSERGTLNAVYEFLERELGVRWYWPGEMGQIVPKTNAVAVVELDVEYAPHFEYRASHQSKEKMDELWTAEELHVWWMRQRLGGFEGRATANHSFNDYPRRFGRQHPEWFALQSSGKRLNMAGPWGGHVCFSHDELFRQVVADIVDYFEKNPTQKFHPVMPGDGLAGHICQCTDCQSEMEPEKGRSGRYSEHVWGFVNRVAREVGKEFPDRIVTCCAYGGYKDVPEGIRFEPNVSVTICRNSGGAGGNYVTHRNPAFLQESRTILDAWAKVVPNIYIWDYHNLRWNVMMKGVPVIAPHGIAEELRHDRAVGVKGHIIEYNTIPYHRVRTEDLPHAWENWLMDTVNIYAS